MSEASITHKESVKQCSVPPPPSATPARTPGAVSPRSLVAAFAHLPDPRRARSVSSALPALRALAVAAILSNHLSVLARAEWGARQAPALLRTLGLADGRTPCPSTLQRLFRKRDGHALAAALSAHFAPAVVPVPVADAAAAPVQGVAVDGKAQRGRLPFPDGGCPVHALTACCHERGVVLAQEPIAQGVAKSAAELSVAPAPLARSAWPGRVLTGAALFCQRHLCPQVRAAGGEYVLLVTETQPPLSADIRLLCDPPPSLAALPLLDQRPARTVDRGHGRRDDGRQLVAATDLNGYVDGPGLAQVFRLRRTWREHGTTKQALHDAITSLSPQTGPPARLLALKRGHGVSENGLHRVKDVTLSEDHRVIHQGQGPTVMALRRDAAVSLLRRAGVRQIAARLRYPSHHPAAAVALLGDPPVTHA